MGADANNRKSLNRAKGYHSFLLVGFITPSSMEVGSAKFS